MKKKSSVKLSLHYNKIKDIFCKEQYLDYIKNATNRHNTTKLRISAHDLEIEKGRYKKTLRKDRTCKWCLLTLDSHVIEDEYHMLFTCDLYAPNRTKLIKSLNKTLTTEIIKINTSTDSLLDLENIRLAFTGINHSSLSNNLFKLQSPLHSHTLIALTILSQFTITS